MTFTNVPHIIELEPQRIAEEMHYKFEARTSSLYIELENDSMRSNLLCELYWVHKRFDELTEVI